MIVDLVVPNATASAKPPNPYKDDVERSKHLANIATIAHENNRPLTEVADCYDRILNELKSRARVHDFLYVFVAKKVSEHLRAVH